LIEEKVEKIMTKNKSPSKVVLLTVVILFIMFAYGRLQTCDAADTITYRLKWLFNTSVVGDLFADTHQYFSAEGLTVILKEGGPERDAIRELELRRAQFGVASADQVIRALSKGADVVVIAQFFQINPLQWIYRPDFMKIDGLGDLKGQVLGVTFGGNDETILRTLLARGGLSENDVTLHSVRYDYTPFFIKDVNFWPVYRNAQAVIIGNKLHSAGEPFRFFNPDDYGVRFVANSLVTSGDMIENQPKMVRKFTITLLQAWQSALSPENMDKAIAVLRRFDRDSSIATLRQQLEITRGLVKPDPKSTIGHIDVDAWKQTEQIMLEQNQVPDPVAVYRVLKPQY
jgi:NitT/TauT family transport system substrate-binding protein